MQTVFLTARKTVFYHSGYFVNPLGVFNFEIGIIFIIQLYRVDMSLQVFNLAFNFWRSNLNTPETLGERLRMVRGKIPQEPFSATYGINQNTLSRYERNERTPDAEFIALVCKNTGITAGWLLLGEGPMYPGEQPHPAGNAPEPPANTAETTGCARCAEMKAELEEERRERRELSAELREVNAELREVNAENRRLAKENKELSTTCATLMERQKHCCPEDNPLFKKKPGDGGSPSGVQVCA